MKHGQPVKVEGSVYDTETGEGYRGAHGKVCGVNAEHKAPDGTVRVSVRLDDGRVVAVPKKALRGRS